MIEQLTHTLVLNILLVCCPLLLLPSIFPSIRVFSNESVLCIMWPKYWSFSFSISPSSEYSGLISFRMDWLDLLAVQGTLKSLLQYQSSKASILLRSAFFIVQLSHPYMTTGKTIALTRWTFVGKVMFLLFNMLSRLVITFLPRSKGLLISRLPSPSAVILEPRKIKSATIIIHFLIIVMSYVNHLDNGPLSNMSFSNNFSQSVACFFILLSKYSYTVLVGSSFLDNMEQNEKHVSFNLAILFLKIFEKHDQKDRYINVYCNIICLSETETTWKQQCVP